MKHLAKFLNSIKTFQIPNSDLGDVSRAISLFVLLTKLNHLQTSLVKCYEMLYNNKPTN